MCNDTDAQQTSHRSRFSDIKTHRIRRSSVSSGFAESGLHESKRSSCPVWLRLRKLAVDRFARSSPRFILPIAISKRR